ncbi:MAG TPA: Ku protein [Conexibacter sp.]|jgi:DNA end-binding protein Ku|nr:Ku protein [Conexibacter sp.]
MARGLWSGTLAFGLVAVPVELVSAVRDRDVHFHEVDDRGQRVEVKRTCAKDGKEVPWDEVGHGYELDGRLVVLSDEELAAAAPERTRTIEVEEFVPLEQIDPAHFDHPYYLLPQGGAEGVTRAYRLLRDTMATREQVAIGRIVMRSREQLVAVRERDGLLALSTMLFANEIRAPRAIDAVPSGRRGSPRRAEVDEALRVIEAMTRDFDPGRYEDCHRSRLLRLIQKKRRGGEIAIPDVEPEPDPVPDLLAALEASLARVHG